MILSEGSQLFRRIVKQANVYHPEQRRDDNHRRVSESFGALASVYTPDNGLSLCARDPLLFFPNDSLLLCENSCKEDLTKVYKITKQGGWEGERVVTI
jgi:hypothetical protein